MGRPKDQQFWDCVERIDGGLQCKFCQKVLNGNPSISRIKSHLSGVTGRGVHICKKVSDDVKLAAYEAIQESNDRRQARPASSNTVVHRNQVEGQVGIQQMSFMHHAPGVENLTENNGGEPVQPIETREEFQPWNQFLTTDYCTPSLETMLMDLGIQPNENTGEALPTTGLIDEEIQPNENRREALLTTEPMDEEIQPNDNITEALVRARELMDQDIQDPGADMFSIFEEKWQNLKRKLQQLEAREADINQQLQQAESSSTKKRKVEVQYWLEKVAPIKNQFLSFEQEIEQSIWNAWVGGDQFENFSKEVMELIDDGRFEGGLVLDHVDCREPFLTTELEGKAFQSNKEKIMKILENDEVLSIGIYGMGGIGKTTFMKHIHNQLLGKQITVYWITVSQDFSIYRLQKLIAKEINLDLSNEDEIIKRAAKLSKAIEKKQKCVLILDDLWDYFDISEVGLPVRANGYKLILTTRSLDVCEKMHCQEILAVNPLTKEEAWRLFQKTLGVLLPSGVTEIAKSIIRECAGLPLGIVTVAASMRGVDDVCEWRNALRELQQSEVKEGDMEKKVFRVLRFSYDRLTTDLQQCFLSCALFPEDWDIEREELIRYLIDEEVKEAERMQEKFDWGHTMLNRLEKVCLLEGFAIIDTRYVKMHDLIRDMAIEIMKTKGVMVKTGAQLVEIPDVEKWGVDLVKVSLIKSNIEEIPSGHSPRCPNLSTLLLCSNMKLTRIAYSFFKQLNGLKILDLSYTNIYELPSSISYLENLNALVLRRCSDLEHVPSLALLKILKRLDLFACFKVENGPQGMEMLSNLRCLDLRGTKIKELPIGMFANLFHLQVLLLPNSLNVKGKELESLRKLEILECTFPDFGEFKIFTTSTPLSNLNHYNLYVGYHIIYPQIHQRIVKRKVYFLSRDFCEGEDALLLPKNLEIVEFQNCTIRKSGLRLKNATQLKRLHIKKCHGIEYLICLSSSPSIFQSLEEIYISQLGDLHFLFSGEDDVATPPPPIIIPLSLSPSHPTFFLKEFCIIDCPKMKKLFPPGLVSNLQNLETLRVECCYEMEEIFAMEEGQESHDSNCGTQFSLPKLKKFKLRDLPQLKSICRGNITCNSLKEIVVDSCEMLKRMPLSLVLMENDTRFDYPKMKKLFPPGLVSNLQNLETLKVDFCDEIEEIFVMEEGQESHDSNCGTQFSLPKLKSFELRDLPQLKSICRGNITCNSLKEIIVNSCEMLKRMPLSLVLMENDTRFDYPKMKKLFPPGLVSNLQNLETLRVAYCDEMEEIFAMEEGQESHDSICGTQFSLPKLKSFELRDLPQLKSICRGNITCNSLKEIAVGSCEMLKRMPLSLVLMENGQLSHLTSLERIAMLPQKWWWESVELVHPNAKNILSPILNDIRYDPFHL